MRLTKDHICEIRGDNMYYFDLNRTVFKEQLLSIKTPDLIDFIAVSFTKMYEIDNRKRALKKLPILKASYVAHRFENDILIVTVKWEVK